jgi:hypothetical protein
MHGKLICNLYALLCWQNFILAKSGCYTGALGAAGPMPRAAVLDGECAKRPKGGWNSPDQLATLRGRKSFGSVVLQ